MLGSVESPVKRGSMTVTESKEIADWPESLRTSAQATHAGPSTKSTTYDPGTKKTNANASIRRLLSCIHALIVNEKLREASERFKFQERSPDFISFPKF